MKSNVLCGGVFNLVGVTELETRLSMEIYNFWVKYRSIQFTQNYFGIFMSYSRIELISQD